MTPATHARLMHVREVMEADHRRLRHDLEELAATLAEDDATWEAAQMLREAAKLTEKVDALVGEAETSALAAEAA